MNVMKSIFVLATFLVFAGSALPARAGGDDVASVLAGNQNLSPSDLANQRGGAIDPSILATATATVSNNVAAFDVTGSNSNLGSFIGASGIFTILQNTGNNVSIQSQTILNVNLN
jgi:hypothetical protein